MPGPHLNIKTVFPGMGISIIKEIFIVIIPIPARRCLYIEIPPTPHPPPPLPTSCVVMSDMGITYFRVYAQISQSPFHRSSSNNWNPRSATFYTTQGAPAELGQETKPVSAQLLWLHFNAGIGVNVAICSCLLNMIQNGQCYGICLWMSYISGGILGPFRYWMNIYNIRFSLETIVQVSDISFSKLQQTTCMSYGTGRIIDRYRKEFGWVYLTVRLYSIFPVDKLSWNC